MASPTAEFGKRYVLLDLLGAGGMGVVYSALDRLTRERVALKRVISNLAEPRRLVGGSEEQTLTDACQPPGTAPEATLKHDSIDRLSLAREFQVLSSLRHPNVIKVLDYGFDAEGQPFFTMELLEGAKDLLEALRHASQEAKVDCLAQVLRALAYLHWRGIVHRDLKPSNVLVSDAVKVLDFGLATRPQESGGVVCGTVTHMAPEIFHRRPPTEASDLYAVGIMAYQMFAGGHPFGKITSREMMDHHLHAEPDYSALPVTPELAAVIRRLLAKDPHGRWGSANEVIQALSEATGAPVARETRETRESFLAAAAFVGREEQRTALQHALARARSGQGEIWLVEGESGIGKSRLLEELRDQALVAGVMVAQGQGERNRAGYHIWRDPLRLLAIHTPLSEAEASTLQVLLPDLETLLDRPLSQVALKPQSAKEEIAAIVRTVFERQAKPVLLLLEDLHWETESLDLLGAVAHVVGRTPVLVVGSYRPEEAPRAAEAVPGARVMRLGPLGTTDMAQLVRSMVGAGSAIPELVPFLDRHSEGNAFFLVETVRALAEHAGELSKVGASRLPERIVAKGMQAVVERRISLVPEEHRLFLELAAVAGREPDPAVLQGVLGAELVERGLAVCADLALFEVRRNAWRFTHDKFREAVLQQLEAGHARDLHRTVAETMERLGAAGEQYATLAYHFRMVGDLAREARYSELAGRAATEKGSYKEARALLERALELRAQFPERNTTEELDLLLRLGSVLIPLCGWAAAEVRRNYDQAVELAVSIGREADVAPALIGLGMFFFLQGQLSEGRSLARRCLELPGAAGDPITRQHACLIQGDTAVWLGEFASDLHYADEIAQIYRPEHLPAHLSLYGMNPRLSSMVSSTVGTWMIGYPDQALERSRRTGELAQQDGNPFSTAIGYQLSAWVHCLRGDAGECLTDALFLGATSAEHGFPLYQVLAQALEGWALARQGEGLRGVDKIREAIQTWKGLNARLVLTFYSTLLADACLRAKLTAAGLAATEAALGGRLGTEERCYMPELHRLRGELLLQAGDSSAGIEAFEASLAVAAEQQARSFEFRAAISLARAAAASARAAEARRRLFQICAWFDDKGETPDLQAARQVLFSVPRG